MHLFLEGLLGDKGKVFSDFICPYYNCPSNQPVEESKPPRWKFNQKIAPRVYQYRCGHCGCLCNKGMDGPMVPDVHLSWNQNPRLTAHDNAPSFNLRNW